MKSTNSNEYLDRRINNRDLKAINAMMKAHSPLVHYPIIGFDFYKPADLRNRKKMGLVDFRAILDNNITSQLLGLITDRQPANKTKLSDETKIICGIAAYLVYSGIEIVPEIAHYERQRAFSSSEKIEDDLQLRIIDHLFPQILASLFMGRISSIPKDAFNLAVNAVNNNSITQENIISNPYDDLGQHDVSIGYSHLLLAWLLYKKESDAIVRLTKYLDWSFNYSLSSQAINFYIALFLSDKRPAKLIKNVDTNDSEIIIKNLQNAAWDLFYLGMLESVPRRTEVKKSIWCFVTRDRPLKKAGSSIFSAVNDTNITSLFSTYYNQSGVSAIFDYQKRIATRKDRAKQVNYVRTHLGKIIDNLELEVRQLLSKKRN